MAHDSEGDFDDDDVAEFSEDPYEDDQSDASGSDDNEWEEDPKPTTTSSRKPRLRAKKKTTKGPSAAPGKSRSELPDIIESTSPSTTTAAPSKSSTLAPADADLEDSVEHEEKLSITGKPSTTSSPLGLSRSELDDDEDSEEGKLSLSR